MSSIFAQLISQTILGYNANHDAVFSIRLCASEFFHGSQRIDEECRAGS